MGRGTADGLLYGEHRPWNRPTPAPGLIRFAEMREAHVEACREWLPVEDEFSGSGQWMLDPASVAQEAKRYVLLEDEQAVALAIVESIVATDIFLIAVDPGKLRRGYGTRLVSEIKKKHPKTSFCLEVHHQDHVALSFFTKLGWYEADRDGIWVVLREMPF